MMLIRHGPEPEWATVLGHDKGSGDLEVIVGIYHLLQPISV